MTSLLGMINKLKSRHKEYIQAEYHIRNPRLIGERRLMLENNEGRTNIMADPFLEAPPRYNPSQTKFAEMNLPSEVKDILSDFAKNEFGVWDPPYEHQADALEQVITNGKDVIVVTGTGSGKTEVFTYSILSKIAQEGKQKSCNQKGIRTLVLYPMNALVSDQLTRIRKMFGIQENSNGISPQDLLRKYRQKGARNFRFAMYTGRTPYHGTYDSKKNERSIKPVADYYNQVANDPLGKELQRLGRVPQKDLSGFRAFGARARKGEPDPKYRPQDIDAEYLTRQEMLDEDSRKSFGGGTPDLLITNYSMLEYMLLRPIEQPLLLDTANWLKDNPDEKLLLVMDEAHLYRGSGGAEVALLLRRFMSRLGIGSERIQFILTSASFSSGAEEFASQLTHKPKSNWHKQGANPIRYNQTPVTGDLGIASELANIGKALGDEPLSKPSQLIKLANVCDWAPPPTDDPDLQVSKKSAENYLHEQLGNWDLFKFFADQIGHPSKVESLCKFIFPGVDDSTAKEAILQLGNLGTMAKDLKLQPLLPTRLHLFYRGLPEHFICSNHGCDDRLHKSDGKFLGKMYLEPRLLCSCGSRTYRLETCRDCGTAYFHVYVRKQDYLDFINPGNPKATCDVWNEPFKKGGADLHLSPVPKDTDLTDKRVCYLDTKTGKLYLKISDVPNQKFVTQCLFEESGHIVDKVKLFGDWKGFTFKKCVACKTQINSLGFSRKITIQDLETSGEQPLSNIVAELFKHQPIRTDIPAEMERIIPNKGKKVLVFSDSRDKASRLAANLQNDIEFDSFRATLFKSMNEQYSTNGKVRLDDVYYGFLWYCSDQNLRFFQSPTSRRQLNSDTTSLFDEMDSENLLGQMMNQHIDDVREYTQDILEYQAGLLRVIGDKYYSMYNLLLGYLEPTHEVWNRIENKTQDLQSRHSIDEIKQIVRMILKNSALVRAIDPNQSKKVRDKSRRFQENKTKPQGVTHDFGDSQSMIPKPMQKLLEDEFGWSKDDMRTLVNLLYKGLGAKLFSKIAEVHCEGDQEDTKGRLAVSTTSVEIITDLDVTNWMICKSCLHYNHKSHTHMQSKCLECGSDSIEFVKKDDPHVATRLGFYRNDVDRKITQSDHPFSIRTEEHTAQVNNRDTYSGEVFSKAEKYELEFQDVLLNQDGDESLGRDQPVDLLSCTTTMEVGIDIGGLTAVALRTVPPRPDNYQQRSGRAGRRGSTLSTIVTYANNSPHEQHYFLNPNEIIGAPPTDPHIQIDNIRLSDRHINAMIFQIYFTDVVTVPQANQNVFESIGLTESFFDLDSKDNFHYPKFKSSFLSKLISGNKHFDQISIMLPNDLEKRTKWRGDPDWRQKFVADQVNNLTNRLDESAKHFTKILRKRRSLGDNSFDTESKLVDYLLRNSFLPSFAFPIDVCTFSVLKRGNGGASIDSEYSPQTGMRQALSTYVPGKEIHIDKKKFQSGGVYVPFPNDFENRFDGEFARIRDHVLVCDECGVLTTWDQTTPGEREDCPNCGAKDRHTLPMYKPSSFAPLSESYQSRQIKQKTDQIRQRPSSVLLPLKSRVDLEKMDEIFENSLIIVEQEEEFYQLNLGPDVADDEIETDQLGGWKICDQCGTSLDVLTNPNSSSHLRPYPMITNGPNKMSSHVCNSNAWNRLAFGYKFNTDMLLIRTVLNPLLIDSTNLHPTDSPLRDAALSAKEAILATIDRGVQGMLDIDLGEIDGHFRILMNQGEDEENILEIYLFDTAPGGAGYCQQILEVFPDIIDRAIEIMEECDCESSCHYCLRNYQNKFEHSNLNRNWAVSMLKYIRDGKVPELPQPTSERLLNEILVPYIAAENGVESVSIKPSPSKVNVIDLSIDAEDGTSFELEVEVRTPMKIQSDSSLLSITDQDLRINLPDIVRRIHQGM